MERIGQRGCTSRVMAAVAFAALAIGTASANPLPIRHEGAVSFVTGGVGQDEAQALRAQSSQWPLAMEFAQREGHHDDYLADVDVQVRDTRGQEVLHTRTDGPFLLAKVPAGRYDVTATADGKTQHRTVEVGRHPVHMVLVWPSTHSGA